MATPTEMYFKSMQESLEQAYALASKARKQGLDPASEVEVKIAPDVAARVESIVGPPGIAQRIREKESTGASREDIAFELAAEIARGEVREISSQPKVKRIEQAIRTSVGLLTEGVLVAPTEGISGVQIKTNPDGSDYLAIYYAGPIRSAGGTAMALSAMIGDVARKLAGVGDYRATATQAERYVEEVNVYEARVSHLQYKPSDDDLRFLVQHCPVAVDGTPTEEMEVSAYRDVPGVETNRIRGGVPLVLCEGIAQKANKLLKYSKKFSMGWEWLESIVKISKGKDANATGADETYLEGFVAGRPVFAYPSRKGGFRLRYGRARTNGLMAKCIHPAVMPVLDGFLAVGTHMKIERPGKGCVVMPHDGLEPPVVKLRDGSVRKVRSVEQGEAWKNDLAEILFLGDMLITYGDFLKSNQPLLPAGFCEEWWAQEVEQKGTRPIVPDSARAAFQFSRQYEVPLHPAYTFPWHDIRVADLQVLVAGLKEGMARDRKGELREMQLPSGPWKRVLEELLVEHRVLDGRIVLDADYAYALLASTGFSEDSSGGFSPPPLEKIVGMHPDSDALPAVNLLAGIPIFAKSPSYIGARMGRPEKAKERKMEGTPHVLFPTGSQKNRNITRLYRQTKTQSEVRAFQMELARFRCTQCRAIGFYARCLQCHGVAQLERICQVCRNIAPGEQHCDKPTIAYEARTVDVSDMFQKLREQLGYNGEEIKGVRGLSNGNRIPERLEKGYVRTKYGVYVFRDGTSRFDATNAPLTHFIPKEIGTSVERLKELGYTHDYLGQPLTQENQLVPMHVQDIVLSENAAVYFMNVAGFVDELLMNFYGERAFYNCKTKMDLVGHQVLSLSPHTSAAVLGRMIGFTKANVGYCHPYVNAARRRNCFQGEEKLLVYYGKTFELLTIRELVERNLTGKTKKDAFGTQYQRVHGLQTFALNKRTKRYELANITHLSKHIAPAHLVKIQTKSGRRIITTPDHPFPDRDTKKVPAQTAKHMLIPWNLNREQTTDMEELDVLSMVSQSNIMIRTNERIFDYGSETPLSGISRDLGLSYKTFTNYIYRNSYPLEMVRQFRPQILKGTNYLLGSRRDKISMRPQIRMNEDFYFLLGFYLAEGYTKNNQKGTHQVAITATKSWTKKLIQKKIADVFGIEPSVGPNTITICSRFVYEIFEHLKLGRNAKTKRIPAFIYSLPMDKIRAFLRGYFSGDGSCSLGNSLEVNVTSVNKWLIDGASFLLSFMGIRHSLYAEKRKVNSKLILRFYGKPKHIEDYKIRIYAEPARKFIDEVGFIGEKQERARQLADRWLAKTNGRSYAQIEGDVFIDPVVKKKIVPSKETHVYNLTVDEHHSLICGGITAFQCDGDEDSYMLLLDALLNFSRHYLDEKRGGTMDAPLVLTPELNPEEVDDEVHALELVSSYPLEFYRATQAYKTPGEVKMRLVKHTLGKPGQFDPFPLTHPGGSLHNANCITRYVQLQSVPEKLEAQFALQDRLRAVDQRNAALRLMESHFIPDLYGNLRSFSRQTFRCVECNESYRRPPLAGKCSRCGGNLLLTIHKAGIEKYLEVSKEIVRRYRLSEYMQQLIMLVEREIKSIFEDEGEKQTGLAEFV